MQSTDWARSPRQARFTPIKQEARPVTQASRPALDPDESGDLVGKFFRGMGEVLDGKEYRELLQGIEMKNEVSS